MDNPKLPARESGGDEKIENEELLPPVNLSKEEIATFQDMMKVGLLYGHKKSKTNPKFSQYILTTRNGIEIIDLAQTLEVLAEAIDFLKKKMKDGASVLVVATQPAAREAVENLAKKFKFFFINNRWIGGLLTNFKNISGRIEHYKKLQVEEAKGILEKYTKKERVIINRRIAKMKTMFTGLEDMIKIPDVIFIIDTSLKNHETALREAKKLNIPVVAVIDSDDNPAAVDYAIPANDHAKSSIDWIVRRIMDALE